MGIDVRQNGHDLLSDDLFVSAGPTPGNDGIVSRPRIGVDYSGPWAKELLRFYLKGNRYVSRR
jgi:DNA-3-methyladenine glycosylase